MIDKNAKIDELLESVAHIPDINHVVNQRVATLVGSDEGLFLSNLCYWIAQNQAHNKNFNDGRYWTYNSLDSFKRIFPYWSTQQLRTVIKSLVLQGVIIKGNYNKHKYDRTCWYALSDLGHKLLNIPMSLDQPMKSTTSTNDNDDVSEPIPINITNNKTNKRYGSRTASPIQNHFVPREEEKRLSEAHGLDCYEEANKFMAHYTSNGKKMVSWDAAFCNWLNKAKQFKSEKKNIYTPVSRKPESIYSSVSSQSTCWTPYKPDRAKQSDEVAFRNLDKIKGMLGMRKGLPSRIGINP